MPLQIRALLLVFTQLVLIVVLVLAPRSDQPWGAPSQVLGWIGLGLAAIGVIIALAAGFGLGRSLTASPIPRAQASLITTGLYARVRHPIYFGLLLAGFGILLDAGYWPQLVILLMLWLVLKTKADFEETLLRERYPEYDEYARKTPQLIPRLFG
jgi:protein-S-isoprenylcysteine O-methyltransferase Ste14